ncbi:CPBP family intramembrane glutamic endopeptidase [Anaerosporobacter faecicola]|uniref:CPBP family intramembrane glutamic endopeptidase n=1 Tax=Anaerosporobacter faecicola TaxID=2718714 RepID=UPI00143C14BF|nr:type II CAAX endopeptidase family protein [Anaerosporobacter faecicola]
MNRKKMLGMLFLCTVLTSIASAYLLDALRAITTNSFVLMFLNQMLLLIPTIVYVVLSRTNLKDTIRIKKISPSNVVLCIIFAFLIMPLMNLINSISLLFSQNMIQDTVTDIVSSNPLILSVFVIAFVPCMVEEIIFRGVFYNGYRKAGILLGSITSALLFGLMHQNINQFTYAFAMGIVFALLIEATDSIVSTMIVHFVINGNSVVMTYLLPKLTKMLENVSTSMGGYEEAITTKITKETIIASLGYYAVSAIIASILAYMVYKTIAQNTKRWKYVRSIFSKKERQELRALEESSSLDMQALESDVSEKVFTIPLLAGIVICLVLMIATEIYMRIA